MRQLKFYFPVPPASVQITADPPVGREGQKLRLTCISASSNPAAVLTWIHNNKQLQVRYTVKKSLLSLSVFVVIGWRKLDHVKRIWHLSPVRAAKVQARLPIRAVSPEPPLLAHTSSESRGTFKQKARSLAPLNGWACAVKICRDGMLEDTNSFDGAQLICILRKFQV